MSTHAREEAAADAGAALALESRRLEKLWDAYKAQEQELQAALAQVQRLTAELAGRDEAAIAVESTIRAKDAEIEALRGDKERLEGTVKELEGIKEDLKALDSYKERITTLEAAYAAERERLAKLYLVYEELETELKSLQADAEKAVRGTEGSG